MLWDSEEEDEVDDTENDASSTLAQNRSHMDLCNEKQEFDQEAYFPSILERADKVLESVNERINKKE